MNKRINLTIFILIIAFSFLFFLPQLRSPQFNLIDDGYNLQIIDHLINYPKNWWEIIIGGEIKLGRMRPLYFPYYLILYLVNGASPLVFWLGQTLSLGITVYFIYRIINHLIKRPILAILASLPIFLLPSVVENFMRLGTSEARQMIWILAGIFYFFKFINKKTHKLGEIITLFLLWTVPVFIKETSVIFLPLYGMVFFFLGLFKTKKKNWLLAGTSMLFTIAIILILPKGNVGYASAFSPSLATAKDNLFIVRLIMPEFWWLFMTASILWAFNLFSDYYLKKNKMKYAQLAKEFTIFGAAIGNLLFPLFWPYQLERYYYPAQLFILIFLVSQVYKFFIKFNFKNKKHKQALAAAPILIIFFSFLLFTPSSLKPNIIFKRHLVQKKIWYEQYQYSGALINYLLDKNLNSYEIAVTHNDYEVIYEIALYASKFDFDKNKLIILNENIKTEEDFGHPFIFYENLENKILTLNRPSIIIRRGSFTDQDLVLWPDDRSLTDPKQVWSITENN